jgi:flagellar basal body-associated protein FliL
MPEEEKAEAPVKKKKKIPKTAVIVGAVALGEAVLFLGAAKLLGGGPDPAHGQDGHYGNQDGEAKLGTVEVSLVKKFKASNNKAGRLWVYEFDIVAKVPARHEDAMKTLVVERKSEIGDIMLRLVRDAEPHMLADEADFHTLRQQLLHALRGILDDDEMIQSLLIPRCVPMRSG